jgi:hypothetical protein
MKIRGFKEKYEENAFSVKNRLRLVGDNLRTPFTGGAEARLGRTERSEGWEVWKKLEVIRARRAVQVRAHLFRFVSALFDIDITEEICGRFGSFRRTNVCISRS